MQNLTQKSVDNHPIKAPSARIKAGGGKNDENMERLWDSLITKPNESYSMSYYLEQAQSELNACGWAFCSFFKTPSGKNAMTIKVHANGKFSYIGVYGSGSGHDFETMKKNVQFMMTYHKKTRLVDGFDFLNSEA